MSEIRKYDVGENIRKYRMQNKLSQSELGERLGVSGQSIYYWEQGKRSIKFDMIEKIAEELGVSIESLLDGYSFISSSSEKITPMPLKWSVALKLKEFFLPAGAEELDEEMNAIIQDHETQAFIYGLFNHLKKINETERYELLEYLSGIVESDIPLHDLQSIDIVATRMRVLNEEGVSHANRLIEDVCALPRYKKKDNKPTHKNTEGGDNNAQENEHKD